MVKTPWSGVALCPVGVKAQAGTGGRCSGRARPEASAPRRVAARGAPSAPSADLGHVTRFAEDVT